MSNLDNSLSSMKNFPNFFFLAVGIWIIGGILGCLLPLNSIEPQRTNWQEHSLLFSKVGAQHIISNNLFVITIALLGFFTAGIASSFILLINGFICILCLKLIFPLDLDLLNKLGIRSGYIIFECLAIWISSTLGLSGLPHMTKLLSDSKLHISANDIL